jgi:hypothetical protein
MSDFHVSEAEDITSLFPQPQAEAIELRQAEVIEVDAGADTNELNLGGGLLHDIPVLQTVTLSTLAVGDVVLVIRFRSMYFILGKIVSSS